MANGQRSLVDIRSFVEEADSIATRNQKIFYLYKIGPKNSSRKETWYYTEKQGKPVSFQIRFYNDSTEITEVYYVQDGRLVCSEEYETLYHNITEDEIGYGNIYYFDNTLVKQLVTMGRSRYRAPRENLAYDVLDRFRKRYAELRENMH